MGTTANFGIPYPECTPPTNRDASDIADMYQLAIAADTALTELYSTAADLVFATDAVRMGMTGAVTASSQNEIPVYDSAVINQNNGMADTTSGVIRIMEPGRYWCGTYVAVGSSTNLNPRVQFLINGADVTNFQTPGQISVTSTSNPYACAVLQFTEPSTLQTRLRHSGAAGFSYTYNARIWAVQLEKF